MSELTRIRTKLVEAGIPDTDNQGDRTTEALVDSVIGLYHYFYGENAHLKSELYTLKLLMSN